METILKTVEPYKKELRKFLPDDLFPAYGFVSICIFFFMFELIIGIEVIDLLPIEAKSFIGEIFNLFYGEKILIFWAFILAYYVISEPIFDVINKHIDFEENKRIGNSNIYGVGVQIRKCVLIYFSILLIMFPKYLSDIIPNINSLLSEANILLRIGNVFFLFIITFWALAEIVGLLKSLFTVNINSLESKHMKEYRINELKRKAAEHIIEISDYTNNKNNLELRIKVVKQIKDELDIIDRGIDLESIITSVEDEQNINYFNIWDEDDDLANVMSSQELEHEDIVVEETIKSLYED